MSISRFWIFASIMIFGIGLLWFSMWNLLQEKPLIVAFFDVGQGDAIFIEAPNGNQVLIDGGPGRNILSEIGNSMDFHDRYIDMVIATHADADHITGLIPIIEQYSVGVFVDNGMRADTNIDKALVSVVQEKNISYVVARRGMRFILDAKRGIFLETLSPEKVQDTDERNATSLIFRLVYGESEILLTGDAESESEKILSLQPSGIASDILKVGHHGSQTSTTLEFVQAVDPKFAVLSYGCDNRYGHPHSSVMETLTNEDIATVSTCEQGTIIFQSDGKNIWLQNKK